MRFTQPGTGESPKAPVYVDGEKVTTLQGDSIVDDFTRLVGEYVERRWGGEPAGAESSAAENARSQAV